MFLNPEIIFFNQKLISSKAIYRDDPGNMRITGQRN
jgi:hypothetical protein